MPAEDRLEEMLEEWAEEHARGRDVPAEELCRDNPSLLPQLREQIEALRRMDALARSGGETVAWDRGVGALPPETPSQGADRPRDGSRGAPERVGGYRVLGVLGEGGMGRVYLAEDPLLNRRIALKVLRPDAASRPDAAARFLREARAAAAVQHDHVVPIYQVGEDGGAPFLAMPLLAGESLEARLRREGPLPPAEVIRVGREAAEGLAAAHAAGLVHRDVKPANLWLEAPSGRIKVLDFGLARSLAGADG